MVYASKRTIKSGAKHLPLKAAAGADHRSQGAGQAGAAFLSKGLTRKLGNDIIRLCKENLEWRGDCGKGRGLKREQKRASK